MSQLVNYNNQSAPINSFMEKIDNCYNSYFVGENAVKAPNVCVWIYFS
jgi:hypothetical protein